MDNLGPQLSQDFIPADQQQAGLERRPLYKRNDEKTAPSDNLANIIVYLSSLYSQLKDNETRATTTAAAVVEPGQKVLQAKRLSRSGASLEQRIVEFGGREEAVNFTNTGLGDFDDAAFVTKVWGETSWIARFAHLLRRRGVTLAIFCVLLLAGLAVMTTLFLEGRGPAISGRGASPTRSAAVPRNEEGAVSDEALKFASLTLDAIGRGELAKAADLLEEAQNRQLALPGIYYQGALLALSQRDVGKMELWTARAMEANEDVAECLYLQANNEAFKNDYKAATESMALAARNASFSPRYFFFWAECLRRQGTPRLALPEFKQALRCRPSSTDAELILFKTWLARIEIGDDPEIQADLTNRLAQEPVSGDTLLLAAANEINRNAYPAAAEFLRRAGKAMPLPTLRLRLRDYIFRTQAEQKDIAPVWTGLMAAISANAPTAPGRKSITDPATRSLAEADPAAW